MKHKTRKMASRWLALVLCLCMLLPSGVVFAAAEEDTREETACMDGLCEHHTEHTEDCGYVEAVEGQPCTHVHDENCGYQEPTEEIPCTHIHDDTCGYVEAVEGQPCAFVCESCGGKNEEQDLLSEEEITISMTNPVGYVDEEYNLLDKATVSPDVDAEGNPIKLRITDLQANPSDAMHEWENPVLKVTENKNVVFTVTYEAYVELADAQEGQQTEKVLANKQFTFPVYASGEIGDRLNGDFAYISDAYLTADEDTESNLAIRTGTAPWDEDDSDGNDSSAMNNTVRSFDVVTYTAAFKTQVRPNGPYTAYKTGKVYYEFAAEGTGDQVRFETESMGWMTAKTEGKYEVTEETREGKTYQVLRGSFLAEPADGNPSAIGNSYQELNIALRVLAMKKGDTVKPQFTFWLEGNDVPESGLVTGSGHSCEEHDEQEYKTIDAPDVSVTSAPRYNVRIVNGHPSVNQTIGTFDFSTGNDLAQNKNAGTKEGRIQAFGVVIQIVGKSSQHGLRGCELPDGSPITFDLSLTSSYRTDEGETITPDDAYAPLLWSIDGNRSRKDGEVKQADARSLNMVAVSRVYFTPTNEVEDAARWGCFDGGQWTGTQNGNTIQVTISGYEVDLEQLPYNNIIEPPTTYQYYNPNNISGYWDIQTACFSAGEIWVVQPFYDSKGNYIADKHDSGTFQITLEDTNLQMVGESGTKLDKVEDNTNQAVQTDDRVVQTSYLSKPGTIGLGIHYIPNTEQGDDGSLALTEGCRGNGKDWILRGDSLGLQGYLGQNDAEGQARIIAADYLLKFDDSFFELERVITYDSSTVLYGAKPEKTGWDHQNLQPDEIGYDTDMMQATADDLIFFSSLDELEKQGYTCVAVLLESRRLFAAANDNIRMRVLGNSKDDSTLDGNVFMITHSGIAWNRNDIKTETAEWCKKEEAELTEQDYLSYVQNGFPSRADKTTPLKYGSDYPAPSTKIDYESSDALKNYTKSQYDENGYVTGTAGVNAGDSCLVVDYSTQITKSPNQPGTDGEGKKLTYDMDTSQREVDYVLYPTAIRSKGESTTEGASTTTTVYIEDTLPAGLEYILNSAYYGGTYASNGGGKAGTVTGGKEIHPAVTENEDGTTTLLFTLENVTITAKEVTRLEPIYYSCLIGTPGNEETDVENQDQLLNSVKIWSDDEQIRDFVATNGNYAEQSITISKNRGVSFSKTSDQKIVEVGEEMGFTIHHGNNSTNSMDVVDIDFLPHNGDGRGTQITGQVIVSEMTIQSKELINGFKLYYTTDKEKQNTTAGDYKASDFTEKNGWIEMTVDADTGTVELPDVTQVIVAVAAVGKLPPSQTLKMHITFDVPDGKPGEYLVNSFSYGDMESNARTYIVNRLLEGVVWLDADKDGLRDEGENLMNGVKVTLMKKGEDGTYTPYQLKLSGEEETLVTASVKTGQQMNLFTGDVSDNAKGTYGFLHLPKGDFAVKFENGETVKINDYTATQTNAGTDDTIDSDAIANVQDGMLVSASIEGIEMPEAKRLTVQTYESRHHDLGLYASQINIPVEKIWNDKDDQDGKRPDSITVKLKTDGKDTKTLKLDKNNNWQGIFTGLNKYKDGKEIVYTVEEVPVEGYKAEIAGSVSEGFTITNTHTPETIDISGSKTWEDNNDQDGKRPESITIRLYADGNELTGKALTVKPDSSGKWTWSFKGLPKYSNGNKITYNIKEDAVDSYTPAYTDFSITNTYTPEKTNVTVTKRWEDNNDQDGIRPQSITVKLLADGEATKHTLTLSSGNNWSGTFTGLDKYRDGGEEIVYTIEEVEVSGYDSSVAGDAAAGFVIMNSHAPEEIDLSGSKTWDDADDQDGKRPDSITVRLYANGEQAEVVTVTAEVGWKWNFTDLPKYADGEEIAYTIKEDAVDGYTPAYTDFNITNTYTPEKTSVSVTKAWEDNNDQDGIRPESITVKLLADGETTKHTLTLSSGNNWSGTFTGLDKYRDGGEEIVYTIEEVEVSGYDSSVTGDAAAGFVITNSHAPEEIDLSGSKTWDDADDQDGKRPDSITIRLYANGEQAEVVTVSAVDSWKWSFTDLPKYENGSEIRYTITEDAVSGYQTEIDGMDVTNHYAPGKINIPVTKNWQDKNDADGIRPDSITVKLYADGKDTGRKLVLDQENSWTGSFDDLDEYDDGVKISYTIAEVEVDGYDTSISGSVETGFVISNSHTPDIPDKPDNPDEPAKPTNPDTPDEPGKPTNPDTPDEPAAPTDPDEPDKPAAPKDDTPQTGDTANMVLGIGLLAVSAAGFTAALVIGKKKKHRRKQTR